MKKSIGFSGFQKPALKTLIALALATTLTSACGGGGSGSNAGNNSSSSSSSSSSGSGSSSSGGSSGGDSTAVVSIDRADAPEGDGPSQFVLTVGLLSPVDRDITAEYTVTSSGAFGATSGESCAAGVDIIATAGSVTIPAGESESNLLVETCGDSHSEPDEAFTVTLTEAGPNAELEVDSATGVLLNDDHNLITDSGITQCFGVNDGGEGADLPECPQADYPGQDAEFGRDANPLTNSDIDGRAGCSYTKIGSDGQPLDIQDQSWDENGNEESGSKWSCVLDNVTGLVWEVKVDNESSLHHRDWKYSWYNSNPATNGGIPGVENSGTCIDKQSCDTEKFAAAVNAAGLCGTHDWRLPTVRELITLVDYGADPPQFVPIIAISHFPNTLNPVVDWSSVVDSFWEDSVKVVSFSEGSVSRSKPENAWRARLVRARD